MDQKVRAPDVGIQQLFSVKLLGMVSRHNYCVLHVLCAGKIRKFLVCGAADLNVFCLN
jgi:hypothetical protein